MSHPLKPLQRLAILCASSLLAGMSALAYAAPATLTETPAAVKDGTADTDVSGTLPKDVVLQHTKKGPVLHNLSKKEQHVQGTVVVPPGKEVNLASGNFKVSVPGSKRAHQIKITQKKGQSKKDQSQQAPATGSAATQ